MRSVLALLLFPLVGLVGAIGYVFLIGRVLGRGDLALVGAIVTLPVFTLLCGILWFGLLRWLEGKAGRQMGTAGALVLSAGVAVTFGLVVVGPRGFTLAGGAELINFSLLVLVAIGALLHRRVSGGSPTSR